jgi:hypothetical protein
VRTDLWARALASVTIRVVRFSLDLKIFEVAVEIEMQSRDILSAIMLMPSCTADNVDVIFIETSPLEHVREHLENSRIFKSHTAT